MTEIAAVRRTNYRERRAAFAGLSADPQVGHIMNAHEQQALDQAEWNALTSLERQSRLSEMGWVCAAEPKARRPRQTSDQISEIVGSAEAALSAISTAESQAGPAATVRINDAKRFQAAHATSTERDNVVLQLKGQRSGLARVLSLKEGQDFILTVNDRVLSFLDAILDLSANLAALTGSDWKSTETWLARNFPVVSNEIHGRAQEAFEAKRTRAALLLASRVIVNRHDYRTAPSTSEFATRFEITAQELRVARAYSGLTSIDRTERNASERDRLREKRRAAGIKAQSERTTRAEDVRLASLAGCSDRTIRTHRLKGDLADWLQSKGVDFPEVLLTQDIMGATDLGSPAEIAEPIVFNDVYEFHGGERRESDADGVVPGDTCPSPFQDEASCSVPVAHSDG